MPINHQPAHYQIHFLLYPQILATSLTLPIEMLRAAESAALRRNRRAPRLLISTAALTDTIVNTQAGFQLQPDKLLSELPASDLIFLPGLWRNPRPVIRQQSALLDWLRQRQQQGATISAVGTGCCLLAEAGLLDGKPATTHWHYFNQFERDYPQVRLKRQYFTTKAGNLYCSASINALADLTVHFIESLYDKTVASHVERHFSHEIRRDFQNSSYYESNSDDSNPQAHPDEQIVAAQAWLQEHYSRDIKLAQVAEQFDMSTRSFNRRFKAATAQTPLQYLQQIRIDSAKQLLQTSNLSISEVAYRVGYQDLSHFTGLFKKQLSTTPSDYRTTVRAKLFHAN